jgi:acyl-CoA thioesterase FadM
MGGNELVEPAPALFAAFEYDVPPSVIDYNDHMTDAAYAKVISDANEAFLEALGLSASYRATGRSLYTVEMTIRFLHEVHVSDVLRAETRLASHDTKRARFFTTLVNEEDRDVATGNCLYLHVDAATARVAEFPADRLAQLDHVQAEHDAVEAQPGRNHDSEAVQRTP